MINDHHVLLSELVQYPHYTTIIIIIILYYTNWSVLVRVLYVRLELENDSDDFGMVLFCRLSLPSCSSGKSMFRGNNLLYHPPVLLKFSVS